MKNKLFQVYTLMLLIVISSCSKKDDPDVPHPEELITRLVYDLTPTSGDDKKSVKLSFEDADGEGGKEPTITGGTLAVNTKYTVKISLFSKEEEITGEITEEDEAHQFFFETDIEGVKFEYKDKDGKGNPIGLASELTTPDKAGKGYIKVILKHEPKKPATNSKDAGGSTDVEVKFEVSIE